MADRFVAEATIPPQAHYQLTSLSGAVGVPGGGGRVALVQALNAHVRWRDDGVDPEAGVGMRLHAGETIFYVGDLTKLKFIEESAGAEVNIAVYQ
jgi:hypothetical protein